MGQVLWLLQKALPPGTFSFACQKRTRKAPATFEAREARIKGCSPLIIPKQMGSIQKIQVASLEDFLCSADFESLTRQTVRVSLCAICRANAPAGSQRRHNAVFAVTSPSCEKGNKPAPQGWLVCPAGLACLQNYKIIFPLILPKRKRRQF